MDQGAVCYVLLSLIVGNSLPLCVTLSHCALLSPIVRYSLPL